MNKYVEIILNEMCSRVNADYEHLDFKSPNWFMEYEWTEVEQDSFKKWLVDYLYNDTKVRKAICKFPIRTKRHLRKVADMFLFQYGWKIKDESNE